MILYWQTPATGGWNLSKVLLCFRQKIKMLFATLQGGESQCDIFLMLQVAPCKLGDIFPAGNKSTFFRYGFCDEIMEKRKVD